MSRNEKRRQKKLQVRKKKRSEKKQTITRIHSSGVSARMKVAGSWKIIDARITAGLWDEGIGYASLVLASRSYRSEDRQPCCRYRVAAGGGDRKDLRLATTGGDAGEIHGLFCRIFKDCDV